MNQTQIRSMQTTCRQRSTPRQRRTSRTSPRLPRSHLHRLKLTLKHHPKTKTAKHHSQINSTKSMITQRLRRLIRGRGRHHTRRGTSQLPHISYTSTSSSSTPRSNRPSRPRLRVTNYLRNTTRDRYLLDIPKIMQNTNAFLHMRIRGTSPPHNMYSANVFSRKRQTKNLHIKRNHSLKPLTRTLLS